MAVGFRASTISCKFADEFVVMGISEFTAAQIAAAFDHQALGIDKPAPLPGLLH